MYNWYLRGIWKGQGWQGGGGKELCSCITTLTVPMTAPGTSSSCTIECSSLALMVVCVVPEGCSACRTEQGKAQAASCSRGRMCHRLGEPTVARRCTLQGKNANLRESTNDKIHSTPSTEAFTSSITDCISLCSN